MKRSTGFIMIAFSIAALAAIGYFVQRRLAPAGFSHQSRVTEEAEIVAKASRVKAVLENIPTTVPFGYKEIAARAAGVQPRWSCEKPENATALETDLIAAASDFLRYRFESSASEYISWREQQGYVRRSMDSLRKFVGIDGVWIGYFGATNAPDLPWDDLFVQAMEGQKKFHDGNTALVGVADDLRAYEVVVGSTTRTGSNPPDASGLLGDAYRFGANGSFPSWWVPPRKISESLDHSPEVFSAYVAFLGEFQNGKKRVCSLRFSRDPVLGRWMIDGCSQATFDRDDKDFARWEY